jgi:outer membrane murein-binding lipoprotein Lpp
MNVSTRSICRTLVCAAATVGLAVVAGCSDEQRRELGEVDVRDTLDARVQQVVDDEGFQLAGDLECTAEIDDGTSNVTSSCTGTTSSGASISGTFTGSADVEAGECMAQLVVQIDSDAVADGNDVDCFEFVG